MIELKVSEDREHVIQGADYWRRVEAHRRRGHISKAQLFGDRIIRDEAPLVYLVAPTLRVHPLFNTLAQFISHDIKLYRFDINHPDTNGNVTLDSPLSTFTPFGLTAANRQIIAPFFADVDTRDPASGVTTFGNGTFNGRNAFGVRS